MAEIPRRLEALRRLLAERGLTHYLVPTSDEHLSEIPAPWRRRREWASGFTGSAGDLLVGVEEGETRLFTDSRYHLQAERELEGTGIGLERVGAPGSRTLTQAIRDLAAARGEGFRLGFDPWCVADDTARGWERIAEETGAELVPVEPNLVDLLWTDRPAPPETPLFPCPREWSGESLPERWARVRELLGKTGAGTLVTVCREEVAWVTGLRSFDEVPHTPVFEGFLIAGAGGMELFVRNPRARLPEGFGADLPGFRPRPYEAFRKALSALEGRVAVDPAAVPRGVTRALEAAGCRVVRAPSPLAEAKAVKTPDELRAMERAGRLASRAKAAALAWLRAETDAGRAVTEAGFRDRLEALYRSLPGFRDLSFPTIAAAGEHAAVVHYAGADETPLRPGELFLVDSGVQLDGGTTDATRTVAVGAPTPEQRRIYTLVLRAHIAAARMVFPEEAPGAAVDAVCRAVLWEAGLDYGHGTGHGVGAFLSVHEGPFALAPASRRPASSAPLKPGMVTSIEPGSYRPGFGGVRLENLYAVVETGGTIEGRKALGFRPLTWIPFDDRLIAPELLTPAERDWLERYHEECDRVLRG